jgi:hypothetical protein
MRLKEKMSLKEKGKSKIRLMRGRGKGSGKCGSCWKIKEGKGNGVLPRECPPRVGGGGERIRAIFFGKRMSFPGDFLFEEMFLPRRRKGT